MLESLHEIDAMLNRLGHKVRRAFLLSQFQGMCYSDIAVELEVSVSSVKKYMAKATADDELQLQTWLRSDALHQWAWGRIEQMQARLGHMPGSLTVDTLHTADKHFDASTLVLNTATD